MFYWEVFLTFSEPCVDHSQKHQGMGFTDHLISDYPIFAYHPHSMQTGILNFIYFRLLRVLCGTMLNM